MDMLIRPIFIIVLSLGLLILLSKKNSLVWCVIAYLIYAVAVFSMLQDITGLGNWWINFLAILVYTPLSFAPFLLHAVFKKYDSFLFTLIFPLTFVLSEYGATAIRLTPGLSIGYYFFDIKPLVQCTAIVGTAGLTFILAWFFESLVTFITRKKFKYMLALCCSTLLLASAVLFGVARLQTAETSNRMIHAAWTTGPKVGITDGMWDIEPYEVCRDSFIKTSAKAHEMGAELLIYSEETIHANEKQRAEMLQIASKAAKEYNMGILLGFDAELDNSDKGANCIFYIDRKGNVSREYDKRMVIPLIEDMYIRGDGQVLQICDTFDCGEVKMAATICYDGNFEMYSRKMEDDSAVYLYPSWDWEDIEHMHTMIAGYRAVENGVTVAKSTVNGESVLVDSYGRILYETNTRDGYEKVYCFDLPCDDKVTIYERYGDKIDLSCAIAAAAVYLLAIVGIARAGKKDGKEGDDDGK